MNRNIIFKFIKKKGKKGNNEEKKKSFSCICYWHRTLLLLDVVDPRSNFFLFSYFAVENIYKSFPFHFFARVRTN